MIRVILKYYIRFRINQYLDFMVINAINKSNMSLAKARFMKARIMYWQDLFMPYGKFFLKEGENIVYSKEMEWMGFTREKLRHNEWEICKNEIHPWTINYFPEKYSKYVKNVACPLDYRESLNPETNTYENYQIEKKYL